MYVLRKTSIKNIINYCTKWLINIVFTTKFLLRIRWKNKLHYIHVIRTLLRKIYILILHQDFISLYFFIQQIIFVEKRQYDALGECCVVKFALFPVVKARNKTERSCPMYHATRNPLKALAHRIHSHLDVDDFASKRKANKATMMPCERGNSGGINRHDIFAKRKTPGVGFKGPLTSSVYHSAAVTSGSGWIEEQTGRTNFP